MKVSLRVLIFCVAYGIPLSGLLAQNKSGLSISGNFTNTTFREVVRQLEKDHGVQFFYNPSEVDTLKVSIEPKDKPLEGFLAEIFAGTDFHYAMEGKTIYITKGREIQTSLPEDFFAATQIKAQPENKMMLDYLVLDKVDKSKASKEERLYEIGKRTVKIGEGLATIAGHIRASNSGEAVMGASVTTEITNVGVATDQFGYYSLTIKKGAHELIFKSVGMKTTKRRITLYADGQLDVEMDEEVTSLKEVTIESEKDRNITGMQMGLEKLDIRTMKKVPVALGEVDILKVVLTLPGVQSVGEATTGLNVRGGATNQNLILFNDATIYNPTHLFGFFSAFNPDVVKNVELYKSGIPAEFGGRLSSVLDVRTREGNKKKFTGSGGIGPLTGRLTLEGPIGGEKTSFLIGVRSTYSDWLLRQVPNTSISNSQAGFYDVNANINHEFNSKNSLYLTGYYSQDHFKLNSDTLYSYQNKNATAKWKHIFSNKLYGVLTGAYSAYDYSVSSDRNPVNAFTMKYAITQFQGKADFSYYPAPRHSLNLGASVIRYNLSPGSFSPRGSESLVTSDVLQNEQALESALYISDNFDVSPKLSLYGGLRYSMFNYLGPRQLFTYANGQTKSVNSIIDTISYPSAKSIVNYGGPEFRLSAKYLLSDNSSVKFSYNRMRQYLQMLSNTAAISPTDIWKLSDPNIKPQIGDQVALGYYKNFRANTLELSVEGYYKVMQNSLDYKGGAKLILNHHIETDVVNAQGKSYGIEILLKKMAGKINGWVSYTYSRSLLRTQSPYLSETINDGQYYPSNYDKPHAVNLIGNYKFSHRFSTSLNVTYSTGRPITLPIAKYELDGAMRLYYSARNQYRIPDYFRIDFSMNIEGNHKIHKLAHSSWTIGIYNLLGRKNPYSVFFESQGGVIKGYQLSIFGQPIPTITYNFKF
ncbi:MAG: TonB-dependent receptor [Bacteroidetes bacterium]|nr:TonB-dependent receptor [Bacteroidota bacterium]